MLTEEGEHKKGGMITVGVVFLHRNINFDGKLKTNEI